MKTLDISGFKAFGDRITLDFGPEEKSMVLYGENGSGKSSIYDALLLVFYRHCLLANKLTIGATPEQRSNEVSDFYYAYRHRPIQDDRRMEIRIDNQPMEQFDHAGCPCFMLDCHAADTPDGQINLVTLVEGMRQNRITDKAEVRQFVQEQADGIVAACNEALKRHFIEAFRIGIENDSYTIFIEDPAHDLRSCLMLGNYFNEAKLHLVNLLLQLVVIRLMHPRGNGLRGLLVMDDVVTSLDASNRSFLIHYLLAEFDDMQVILMTHNLGFNNVFYNITKESGCLEHWFFANLYLNAGGSHLYDYTRMQSATGIKEAFHSGQLTLDNIGTMIRRRFEALLLEVCKILSIGANEEASTLINRLLNDRKPIYLRKSAGKIDIADDLVQEIYQLASKRNTSGDKLSGDILKKIASFHTKQSLGKLIPIIRQFREYEKLVIHELSHGYSGMPPFNQKEVEASLVLLEKMEQCVKSLRTKNGGM